MAKYAAMVTTHATPKLGQNVQPDRRSYGKNEKKRERRQHKPKDAT